MEKKNRVGLLDELRGFAILCMVVYHLMYNLKYIFGIDVPIFFDDWFYVIRDIFAGMFICISGICCNYSKNNLKRGVQCFFIGMVMTFVTAFVTPSSPDSFGILHCLGICMMVYGLVGEILHKIPSLVGIIASVFLFALTFNFSRHYIGIGGLFRIDLPPVLYSTNVLFPLGMPSAGFVSLDYFPLLPWMFLFMAGVFFGVYVKNGLMPKFVYRTRVPFFAACGRYSIWIYVLHQPILFGILCLIFQRIPF